MRKLPCWFASVLALLAACDSQPSIPPGPKSSKAPPSEPATVARDVEAARARLDADAETLAAEATERILGRRAS